MLDDKFRRTGSIRRRWTRAASLAAALSISSTGGLAVAHFDSGPAIISNLNASNTLPGPLHTVVIGRNPSTNAGSDYLVVSPNGGAWQTVVADAAGFMYGSDPAAAYMDTAQVDSGQFTTCGRSGYDNGIYCSRQHIDYSRPPQIFDFADDVAARVGTQSFAADANPALVRKYSADLRPVGLYLFARNTDNQIWSTFRGDSSSWSEWSQLPTVSGGLGDPAAVMITDGSTGMLFVMVCAAMRSSQQMACTQQTLIGTRGGPVFSWTAWTAQPGFSAALGDKPALARSADGIFLFAVIDGFDSLGHPNSQLFSWLPNGGTWSAPQIIPGGWWFGKGPAAVSSPLSTRIMNVGMTFDGQYWYDLDTTSLDQNLQPHFSGWGSTWTAVP